MNDVIYRQELIDRLNHVIEKGVVSQFSGGHPITAEVVKRVVETLPSAEPKIVRCRECKHYRYDNDDIMPYCIINSDYGWKNDDFCSYAERREE